MTIKANIYDYKTLSEWYKDNHKYYPIQILMAVERLMKTKNITFHKAFEELINLGAIIELQKS